MSPQTNGLLRTRRHLVVPAGLRATCSSPEKAKVAERRPRDQYVHTRTDTETDVAAADFQTDSGGSRTWQTVVLWYWASLLSLGTNKKTKIIKRLPFHLTPSSEINEVFIYNKALHSSLGILPQWLSCWRALLLPLHFKLWTAFVCTTSRARLVACLETFQTPFLGSK